MRDRLALVLIALVALAVAAPALAQSAAVSRVVVVDTDDPAAYSAAIAEGQRILTSLGSDAELRVWRGLFAGEGTGGVVVTIEYESMSALGADMERMAGSEEMTAWLAGLDAIRTIVSDSVYQDIGQ